MFRHLGRHYVQKYEHALVINPVYCDIKPTRGSVVLTSASSRHSRTGCGEEGKKSHRTYLFSPQTSLRKYLSKSKCQSGEGELVRLGRQVKLVISTMSGNKVVPARTQTPTRMTPREAPACLQCQNRLKHRRQRQQTMETGQQNPGTRLEPIRNAKPTIRISQPIAGDHSDRTLFLSARSSSRHQLCPHLEFKPWEMNASQSSI